MRVILQRVRHASVTIDGQVHGAIQNGFLALVGITQSDDEGIVKKMAKNVLNCVSLRMNKER